MGNTSKPEIFLLRDKGCENLVSASLTGGCIIALQAETSQLGQLLATRGKLKWPGQRSCRLQVLPGSLDLQ